ncbi:hypothetical protein COY27_07160 [Candidatus Woesearchaeota archaeon CG_4_10_14_0_2_um_filter_33_13]|nr:MAG: hypothetical protein COY27_07160 [Candidatus Woesearchaeota archaeon CG_4_10_14_0_2_um_filter_33_13]
MSTEILFTIISSGGILLGVFAGYWFSSINKKTEISASTIQDNTLEIRDVNSRLTSLKEANAKAELELKQSMYSLSKEMRETARTIREIANKTETHTLKIQNLEDQHKYISDVIRKNKLD